MASTCEQVEQGGSLFGFLGLIDIGCITSIFGMFLLLITHRGSGVSYMTFGSSLIRSAGFTKNSTVAENEVGCFPDGVWNAILHDLVHHRYSGDLRKQLFFAGGVNNGCRESSQTVKTKIQVQ
ncbi:hypothetical protein OSB04_011553 [Centaurea solstitialis]|uniref:Uncharacterized protein n=1 Tax=Centaurea solstitialis TaxID=347529 RepID=A0AA38WP83_9ASTR|nr:hypothetical protein OSB04_011553 [Centaurea solstitialis]